MTILGVSFTHTLSFAPHVLKVASKAGASLYALKTLKAHGLNGQALCDGEISAGTHAGTVRSVCNCALFAIDTA